MQVRLLYEATPQDSRIAGDVRTHTQLCQQMPKPQVSQVWHTANWQQEKGGGGALKVTSALLAT